MRLRAGSLLLLGLFLGCSKGGGASSDTAGTAASLAASAPKKDPQSPSSASPSPRTVIDFLSDKGECTFGHRGVLIDLGDPSTRSRMSGAKLSPPDVEVREHQGASWAGIRTRSLELSFVSSSELKSDAGIVIEARVRGGAAKSVSVYLNQKPIGTLSFTKGETGIVATRAPGSVVAKGTNELLLRFNGGGGGGSGANKSQHDELAEIDWIRVGPNDGEAPYSAPTRSDAVTTLSIANGTSAPPTPRRSVSLRGPGFARCSAFIPNGSMLEGFVGVTTGGEAEAEVRVLVDRAEPRVIGTFHLGGPTDPTGWRPLAIPLGDVGTIGAVELVAKSTSKGARVAFGEARVVEPLPPSVEPAAAATANTMANGNETNNPLSKTRGVIMIVLGSTSRRLLSIHGGTAQMPELTNLASGGGTIFEAHRATSSFASGALGSMLTGVTPREHGASDADAMLSSSVFTVAEAARQAGVVTAMFTANPTTTSPYGFARGWETFTARLPGEAVEAASPATGIFDDAKQWLETHKADRFFMVVHARGGHPPWDVTSEELKDLPPANYQGSLEPKHAGEALAKARKSGGGGHSFADPDRERAFALHSKALVAHDAAIGALAAHVRTIGRDKDTVWIVTGDIGIDAAARVPFLEEESLEEGALAVPLIIRAPADVPSRARVSIATSGVDVAPTILEALGLPPPPQLRGESLWPLKAGAAGTHSTTKERPLIASTTTRLSARWGAFAITTFKDREVKVCNLSLDPDCVSDVRPSHPIAAEVLHALAWTELVGTGSPAPAPTRPASSMTTTSDKTLPMPTKAVADGPTSAALRVWGR